MSVAARAASRSAKEPPKRSSTRIETAAAPLSANDRASAGGVGVRPQVARRRRAALHLGDGAETGLGERVAEASHQAGTSCWLNATSASSRSAAAPESTASVASR